SDQALHEGVEREARGLGDAELRELGLLAGNPEVIQLGFDANENPPVLHTHDRYGNRIDEVRFHPSWHVLMATAAGRGLHAAPWADPSPNAHVHRAAKFFVWSQVEGGHGCPISMTYAAIPALKHNEALAQTWFPKLAARSYDPRLLPIEQKTGAICGMGMTEKQGGSDVRANQTRATRVAGDEYVLQGHKWFCSAPMSDAFLVLAQADAGLSCFFVPRVLLGGSRNPFAIQRLKDKLGNRSNASAEVEFHGTFGWLIGEEGRGVQTIVEMVNQTRLDCIIGSAALLRAALAQAIHHATYRHTFGRALVKHALMQNVLADLAIESEAATALFLRLARAVDDAPNNPHAAAIKRIGTAIGKYYVCKRAPAVTAEALECLGGNGYVEESIMPRLYREAPLNSIWEGSGNINALDVLRILQKQPEAVDALFAEFAPAMSDSRIAKAVASLEHDLRERDELEWRARSIVERMALLWQASLLVQYAPNYVSDVFVATRVNGEWGHTMGTLPLRTGLRGIIDRAAPQVEHETATV
ncbi:MAG TPA: acyl-CoA dehydrogenase family protein, partial [Candidatus Aquilonibacter sp.]|nr:acyl-CoA dehydrogenase family protein [Candidatus Aquilonibacter sp.]